MCAEWARSAHMQFMRSENPDIAVVVSHLPEGQIAAKLELPVIALKPMDFTSAEWEKFATAQARHIAELAYECYGVPVDIGDGKVQAVSLILGGDEAEAREPIDRLNDDVRNGEFVELLRDRLGFQGYGSGTSDRTSRHRPEAFPLHVTPWNPNLPAGIPGSAELTGHQRESITILFDAGLADARIGCGTTSEGDVYFAVDAGDDNDTTAFIDTRGTITSISLDSSDHQLAPSIARLSRKHPLRAALVAAGVKVAADV